MTPKLYGWLNDRILCQKKNPVCKKKKKKLHFSFNCSLISHTTSSAFTLSGLECVNLLDLYHLSHYGNNCNIRALQLWTKRQRATLVRGISSGSSYSLTKVIYCCLHSNMTQIFIYSRHPSYAQQLAGLTGGAQYSLIDNIHKSWGTTAGHTMSYCLLTWLHESFLLGSALQNDIGEVQTGQMVADEPVIVVKTLLMKYSSVSQ